MMAINYNGHTGMLSLIRDEIRPSAREQEIDRLILLRTDLNYDRET